ncbi:MAG: M20/M25/M40 family metallo-hydrolase [Bacteroidales bacterium]|nr:M20/M25/M40 family metallo-hydrolase [Bacteroidales bacterium]
MKKYIFLTLALLVCVFRVSAQNDKATVQRILEEGLNNNKTMEWEDVLTNRFGGRLIGSHAYSDACDWAEAMFKSWGLKVYRQEVGEVPVGFNRGPWFGRMIGGSNSALHFTTPSYTAGTKGVQRGHVVREPKSLAEFEKIKGTLKGAWVLIGGTNSGWPIDIGPLGAAERAEAKHYNDSISAINRQIQANNRNINNQISDLDKQIAAESNASKKAKLQAQRNALKPADPMPLKDVPALFYDEMKEAGVLGFIQSSEVPIKTLYDRKNLMQMTWETLPELPDIKLDEDQYNEIAHLVDRNDFIQLEFDIRNHFTMTPVKYHNIIAEIPGTEFPDEYVIVGGHLDCYDVATGGVDCCVGSTVAMEVGRILAAAGAKPKRTIILALWAAEEYGLWGSQYFVQSNMDKMGKISNYFNRDSGPTVPVGATVTKEMYDDWVAISEPLKGHFPFEVKIRTTPPQPRPTSAGGSDHAYFQMNGVPTIGFDQGDPTGSNFNYSEIWHTDRDLYNKTIPENQENTSTITAVIAYGLANLDHILDRTNWFSN